MRPACPFSQPVRRARSGERRREPRHTVRKLLRATYEGRNPAIWVIQCSARGVAMLCPISMEPGGQFTIHLELHSLALLVYTVRYCIKEPNGWFRIGGELVRVSAQSQVAFGTILNALQLP